MGGWKEFKESGQIKRDDKIRKLGLLIVDDEDKIVKSLEEMFKNVFDIYYSSEPLKGLELFKENLPKLILSDQRMPLMTGIDLFRKIKEINPETIRILITGYSDINVVVNALNEGLCWKYITKPWDHKELREIVLAGASHYLKANGDSLSNHSLLGF